MNKPRLAIVAKSFDKPSETFIRQHATELVPSNTVLIGTQQTEQGTFSASGALWAEYRAIENPVRRALEKLRFERDVHSFLDTERVEAVLVEYGTVGARHIKSLARSGRRVFVHFHGYDATRTEVTKRLRRRYREMFKLADGFFTPSQFIADRIASLGCPPDKITVCPCGVDPQAFEPSLRQPGRLIAVGRFVEKKSPLSTIKAFEIALKTHPELHLDFVGDGELLPACKKFARDAGIADKITFHGAQPHDRVQNLMGEAAIFLQHSVIAADGDCEGLPVAVLEAMASAIPVVATRHSGIPEAVTDGKTGCLVDEHDIEAMAAALTRLISSSDEELEAMASAARERIETEFSADHSLQRIRQTMSLPNPD